MIQFAGRRLLRKSAEWIHTADYGANQVTAPAKMLATNQHCEMRMTPSIPEREALFKTFSRALFTRDVQSLYRAVTPDFVWSYHDGVSVTKRLCSPGQIADHLAEQSRLYSAQRFHGIVYHHLPELTFMTMRVSETVMATGEKREQTGIECYSFEGGKIATKNVYRKPTAI